MFRNPKTTVIGVVLIGGSLLYLGMRAMAGTLEAQDLTALAAVLAGSGLLAAKDEGL